MYVRGRPIKTTLTCAIACLALACSQSFKTAIPQSSGPTEPPKITPDEDNTTPDPYAPVLLPDGHYGIATFKDEFDAGTLDTTKWLNGYQYGDPINSELQYYAPDAFEYGTSSIKIKATNTAKYGMSYQSGAITTAQRFMQTYGYFEMRAKVPAGNGFWPAFWMLPEDGSWPPEIDILELLGEDPTTAHMNVHWTAGGHQDSHTQYTGVDFSLAFHTFAVSWRPGELIWFIDGVERKRYTGVGVPSTPHYMLANLAIGGSWPVPPDGTTPFPSDFEIDYVKAYQYADAPAEIAPAIRFNRTTVSNAAPAVGDTITMTTEFAFGTAQTQMQIRYYLYDHLNDTSFATKTVWTPATGVAAGDYVTSTTMVIPGTAAGEDCRLSIGIFKADGTFVTWLGTGAILAVP